MSGDRVRICDESELEPGDRTLVDVDGVEVGVINVDGELYAMRNSCPHRDGPVCEGKVTNALVGTWPGVGERLEERMSGDPAIACPWHGWEFDLATGDHLGDATFSVETYDVVVEDDVVYVER
jgi:nitrite reductase/ring-hydroxylating ferredoxin subunit